MRTKNLLTAGVLAGLLGLGPPPAWAITAELPFPSGRATVVAQRFCRAASCDPAHDTAWQTTICRAVSQWNDAGADLSLTVRLPSAADQQAPCPPPAFGGYRIYINAASPKRRNGPAGVLGLLTHELGHVLGLDHPDEAGQTVAAIMNSQVRYQTLQADDIAVVRVLYGVRRRPATHE